MYYEERRCEHGKWWYRDDPDSHWHKFSTEMLLEKLNETYDELQNLKRIYEYDPPSH